MNETTAIENKPKTKYDVTVISAGRFLVTYHCNKIEFSTFSNHLMLKEVQSEHDIKNVYLPKDRTIIEENEL